MKIENFSNRNIKIGKIYEKKKIATLLYTYIFFSSLSYLYCLVVANRRHGCILHMKQFGHVSHIT